MTEYTKIQGALNKYLYEMGTIPDVVVWENRAATPVDGEIYLMVNCLPVVPDHPFIGPATKTKTHEHGIFQVSIMAPNNEGWGEAYDMVDAIVSHFSRNASMDFDGSVISFLSVIGGQAIGGVGPVGSDITINIRKAWPSPGYPDGTRYRIPVNISYYGYM